jgi:hypothetical protein
MEGKEKSGSALKIKEGIPQPPSINPLVLTKSGRKKRENIRLRNMFQVLFQGTGLF